MFDPAQGETSGGIIEPSDHISGNSCGNREHDDDQHRAAEKSPGEIDDVLRHRNQLRSDEIIKDGTAYDQKGVGNEPEFIFCRDLNFFRACLGAASLGKSLPDLRFL